jgi:AAA+ ATPase superfamily predicted ATPase
VDTLHNNSIMIHGERRIGKTSLLYHLSNVLREANDLDYWFVPLYLDLEGTTQETFFHFLLEEIAGGLRFQPTLGDTLTPLLDDLRDRSMAGDGYTDRDFSRDLREIVQALQAYGDHHYPDKQLRLILLMDEMDVINNYDHLIQQQLRRIFMRDFAANLGAVVAGIQISKTWDRVESPWYNLFNEIKLEPFTREQALELLTQPVRGYYVYDQAALEFIVDKCEGRPFRIQQYGLEAVNHMLAHGRRRIRLDDAEAAHRAIQNNAHDQEAQPPDGDRRNGEFASGPAPAADDGGELLRADHDVAGPAEASSEVQT